MTMTLHKLTAGDGYEYLTRQVAAADSTTIGRTSLSDYYSAKGESPGRWVGSGLTSLSHVGAREISPVDVEKIWAVPAGSVVTGAQMRALFGEGHHPNAEAIIAEVTDRGLNFQAAQDAAKLGREFYVRAGETGFVRDVAVAFRQHNAALGRQWNAPISASVRAAIRTALAREKFATKFGRVPADDRELTGFIARETRARTTAVAGYDLTFSPVKSVSALWAIGPREVATTIEEAHDAAVADALAWLEKEAAFTRCGTNGIAQLDTTGLIGAAFTHRDSRAGDPDLHTHVAISNKVAAVDGDVVRWLALDGQPLHRVAVAASELYNTRLEAHLGQRLGVAFADVAPDKPGKRAVREIVGVAPELLAAWSSRRAVIERRTAELSKEFQSSHGREPTLVEMIALAQQATLESREAKHEPRCLADQRHTWREQAIAVLGGVPELTAMLTTVLCTPARRVECVDDQWISARAAEAIATVSGTRATWSAHHVIAEAQRIVRATGHADDECLVDKITAVALAQPLSLPHARVADAELGEPEFLRRRDGASVFRRHGTAAYTSPAILAAERRILAAVHHCGARRVSDTDVELALADSQARGKPLNPGQVALVTEMATTERRVALALAPAGTGKTTAMAALSNAWRSSGGHVIGLAPTASAAIELGHDLAAPTDTLAKLVWSVNPATPTTGQAPRWLERIGPDTLVIIDEAGKAGTLELDAALSYLLVRGASVRLVGDDRQLGSISAGGVLRDIAAETEALTLSELVRFACTAEGAATLAIRVADPAGLAYYIDNHRVHVGSEATAADMAYAAWKADIDAGKDSVLLAATNTVVDELNARAHLEHINSGAPRNPSRDVILADQLTACDGDIIRTRRNARWLPIGRDDYVRNGYRFRILDVGDDGGLKVRHLGSGRVITIPAQYVASHVTLGYANTIDGAQGLTAAHASHIVGAAHLTRQLLYVALTRGRIENHIYLSTAESDPHRVLAPKATHPETAVDVLTRTLQRDGAQLSATTAARQAADPFTRLGPAAQMYHEALCVAAEAHLSPQERAALDSAPHTLLPGLHTAPAWPVLRRHLALLAAHGGHPVQALADAIAASSLHDAHDPAAVLDWRIDPSSTHSGSDAGPLPWLSTIPDELNNDPLCGPYLRRRANLLTDLCSDIRATATSWTVATAPAWARCLIGADPDLTADIAIFRAAHRVAPEDSRLLGPPQYAVQARSTQRHLAQRASAAITLVQPDTARFKHLIDAIEPRITTDTYWPVLAERLAGAAPTRPDLAALVRAAVDAHPLPDELPAAALWWRLSAELTPTATLETTHSRILPPWTPQLHAVFGSAIAETIAADPAWPALVSAIAAADPTRWTPAELLHVAAEQLADADPAHRIPVHHYARLITYTIDLLCTAHPYRRGDQHLPDHPPLSPDEEEQLPLDPQAAIGSEHSEPNPFHDEPATDEPTSIADPSPNSDGVDFADLSTTRPGPRALAPAVADAYALRDRYTASSAHLAALTAHVRANDGPAMRAAQPQIRDMRQRADADRPHLLAVQELIAAWAEADRAYEDALQQLNAARAHLDQLRADPHSDPLDLESARRYLQTVSLCVPTTSPAQQFQPQLAQAHAARAAAAGGAEHIVSGADVDAYIAAISNQDIAALNRARREHAELRIQLDRAEAAAAAAFADATTRTAQHLADQQHQLDTEMRLLEVAGTNRPERAVAIGRTALAGMDRQYATALAALAELPYTVAVLHSAPGQARTQALHTLRCAYSAVGRKVLWCSPTEQQAQLATDEQLADTATTLSAAHTQLRTGSWQLPPNSLIIIDDAATADPDQLADLAELVDQSYARLILIDHHRDTWPPQPAQKLLRLLDGELPWRMTLGPIPVPHQPHHHSPDLDPILFQTRRHDPHLLNQSLTNALQRANHIRATNTHTHQRHLTTTWTRHQHHDRTAHQSRDNGIEMP